MKLVLPKWYDLHTHFRQDDIVGPLIADHVAMGCAGALAMPNTKPPVAKVFEQDGLPYKSLEAYLQELMVAGADAFDDLIVPLYLTKDTTSQMIEAGAKAGILRAAKYYPPHGTTGAEFGSPFEGFIKNDVFRAMRDNGVVLCIHGEEHGLPGTAYFDRATNAEEIFYKDRLPRALDALPDLRIVCEHVTTAVAAAFVSDAPSNVGATVTPQHLLYTTGDLLKGFKYHLYCLPLIKFAEDRAALRKVVTGINNHKFFAGTDSAPHVQKATPCGCAAGCYTGGIAPQLYAQAFEEAGCDLTKTAAQDAFKRFLCLNGPGFYGLDVPEETFVLEKAPQEVRALKTGAHSIMPLPLGMCEQPRDSVQISWRIA